MRPHAGVDGLVHQVPMRRLAPKLAAVPQAAPLVGLDAVLRRHVRPHGGGARRVGKVAALLGAEEALGRLALGVLCLVALYVGEVLAVGPDASMPLGARRDGVGGAAAAAVPQARRLALRIVDAAAGAVAAREGGWGRTASTRIRAGGDDESRARDAQRTARVAERLHAFESRSMRALTPRRRTPLRRERSPLRPCRRRCHSRPTGI